MIPSSQTSNVAFKAEIIPASRMQSDLGLPSL